LKKLQNDSIIIMTWIVYLWLDYRWTNCKGISNRSCMGIW